MKVGTYNVAGTKWTSTNGSEERKGQIEIEINPDQIARQLGHRALFNKTGKASFLKGAIVVRKLKGN